VRLGAEEIKQADNLMHGNELMKRGFVAGAGFHADLDQDTPPRLDKAVMGALLLCLGASGTDT